MHLFVGYVLCNTYAQLFRFFITFKILWSVVAVQEVYCCGCIPGYNCHTKGYLFTLRGGGGGGGIS